MVIFSSSCGEASLTRSTTTAVGSSLQQETSEIGRTAQRLHVERQIVGNLTQRALGFVEDIGSREEIQIVSDAMMKVKSGAFVVPVVSRFARDTGYLT
jgi:hypothetical protein